MKPSFRASLDRRLHMIRQNLAGVVADFSVSTGCQFLQIGQHGGLRETNSEAGRIFHTSFLSDSIRHHPTPSASEKNSTSLVFVRHWRTVTMKSPDTRTTEMRPDRAAKIDTRCSSDLRRKLERIAAIKEADLSDVVREALRLYAAKFDQQIAA